MKTSLNLLNVILSSFMMFRLENKNRNDCSVHLLSFHTDWAWCMILTCRFKHLYILHIIQLFNHSYLPAVNNTLNSLTKILLRKYWCLPLHAWSVNPIPWITWPSEKHQMNEELFTRCIISPSGRRWSVVWLTSLIFISKLLALQENNVSPAFPFKPKLGGQPLV